MTRTSPSARATGPVAYASVADTLAVLADVICPTLAKGVLIRRPMVVGLSEALDLDGRAVRRMQALRAKYGTGPLMLAIPGRRQALVLAPGDVDRILAGTDEPFTPATLEKRAALGHFEPAVSLISFGVERAVRRALNDAALESGRPVHPLATGFLRVVAEEAAPLIAKRRFGWTDFTVAWHRMVRRVVLGEAARDDHDLTDTLARLRAAGNWAFFHPGRKRLFRKFHARLQEHLQRPGPGSLAAQLAAQPQAKDAAPADQVAHWLFAFEPAGMATIRALALLAAHPDQQRRARAEIAAGGPDDRANLPFLRACVLESLRLWPTTPVILRETTRDVDWPGGNLPRNTHLSIFAPFFHRDDENLPYAHRFAPDLWLEPDPGEGWALVPFSGGPGICPGRHVVQMLGSAWLAALVDAGEVSLSPPSRLDARRPMPGILDHSRLDFVIDRPDAAIVVRLVPEVAPVDAPAYAAQRSSASRT